MTERKKKEKLSKAKPKNYGDVNFLIVSFYTLLIKFKDICRAGRKERVKVLQKMAFGPKKSVKGN